MSAGQKQGFVRGDGDCGKRAMATLVVLCLLILVLMPGCVGLQSREITASRSTFFQKDLSHPQTVRISRRSRAMAAGIQSDLSRPEAVRILQKNLGLWDPNQPGFKATPKPFWICYVPELKERISRERLVPDLLYIQSIDELGFTYYVTRRFVDGRFSNSGYTTYCYHLESTAPTHITFADVIWIKPRNDNGWNGPALELDDAAKCCLIRFDTHGIGGYQKQLNQLVSAFYALCPNAN